MRIQLDTLVVHVQALRVAYAAERADLVETDLAPAAAEAAAASLQSARGDEARVAKYLARYREVQQKRAGMEAALAADPDDIGDLDDGGASEARTQALSKV